MNEVLKAIKERRSIRKYKSDMLPKEIIDQVIESGLYAASGKGQQSPIIISVTNKELRDKLSRMNCEIGGWKEGFDPFFNAPVVLIVLAPKDWTNKTYDGSLVMGNMMLAAHALNIGSCWINRARQEFETEEGKEIKSSEKGVTATEYGLIAVAVAAMIVATFYTYPSLVSTIRNDLIAVATIVMGQTF